MSLTNSNISRFEELKNKKIQELNNKYNSDCSNLATLFNKQIIDVNSSVLTSDDDKMININKLINDCNYQKQLLKTKLNNDILEIQKLSLDNDTIKILEDNNILEENTEVKIEVYNNSNTEIINKINKKISKLLEYYNNTIDIYNKNINDLNNDITTNTNELNIIVSEQNELYKLISDYSSKINELSNKIADLNRKKSVKTNVISELNKNVNINNKKIELLKYKLETNQNKAQNIKIRKEELDENDVNIIDDDISVNDNEINLKNNVLEKVELTKSVSVFSNKVSDLLNKINKKALLYGINYYNTPYRLSGCLNDAQEIKNLLLSSNFKEENIKLYDDSISSIRKPTRKNMLEDFTNLVKSGNSGDELFFYYSGHGSNILDKNGDEKDGYDELIIPCDFNPIIDDELKQIIKDNLKENVTLIALFDCCFSGSVLDLKYQYLDSMNNDRTTVYSNELDTKGNVVMISGCADNQTSSECLYGKIPRGAMTVAFRIVLGKNKNITWRQLLKEMRNLLKGSSFKQIPQLSSGKFINIDSQVFI